jgi:hypothetical protein
MSTSKPKHSDRAHALLSASSAERWLACPPSAVAAEAYVNEGSEFTREGTLAHEVAEFIAGKGDSYTETDLLKLEAAADAGEITKEMQECALGYRDYILEQIRDDNALIMLEQRVDFSPWVPGGFGTADCIIIQGDTMDVIDYKYGKGVAVSAIDNPQEMCYGLGALNDYGFAYDIDKIRLHIYQPRINNVSVDEMTADELLGWADKVLKPKAELAARGIGGYKAGSHCKFCPHAGQCRELTKICSEYVHTHGLEVQVPKLAPFEVAEILAMEPLISLWLKRVKDQALASMLHGEQVPGYKVVAGRGSRNWADDIEVAATLFAAGYAREDYTETKILSVAQMEKALGKKKVAELVGGQILSHTGAPTIALETDKRPVYNPADDFDNLEATK